MTEIPEISAGEDIKADKNLTARQRTFGRGAVALRVISAIALGLGILAAMSIVILCLLHCFQPNLLPWTLKSAVPLILIGIAFASLQFALPRTRSQMLLSLMVAVAFILWGVEQFLLNRAIASFIDDVVVFLFVLDLSIVIFGHLKPGAHPAGKELPFDESDV
jgi:hypothetical protein